MKKILLLFILFGITLGIVNGIKNENIQQEQKQYKEIKNENLEVAELSLPLSDVDTLNPLRTKRLHLSNILKLIYEPLYSYDEENQLTPILVEQAMVREDNSWVLRLKDNVFWHNGEKFTANDVKYTIDILMVNDIDSIYNSNIKNIANVEIIDEKTISITLVNPDSYFLSKLTFPIVSKNYFYGLEMMNEAKANMMMGTGAYKYVSEQDGTIILSANNEWWKNEIIKLKTVNLKKYATYSEAIKGFKSSEVDMMITNMYDWKENFGFIGINSYRYENSEYELLIPNAENKIFSDSSVRKALLYGINRPNIVSTIYDENAVISDLPIMSNSKYAETSVEYNPEISKEILTNGGWIKNEDSWRKGNITLKFNLQVCKEDLEKVAVAEKIKNDLAELGIKVTIKEVTWENLINSLNTNKFEIILMSIDIKNEYQLQSMVNMGETLNYANFVDININILAELKNLNGEAYDEKMKIFKEAYINELPYIGLYFKVDTILTNKSVKGEYKSTVYEPYRNLINFYK